MTAVTTRPEIMKQIEDDPFEQLCVALENPLIQPYLKPDIKLLDPLTQDIEQQLDNDGKLFWFSENWPNCLKSEAAHIVDKLELNKEDYEVVVGNNLYLQEIWASQVVLRNKETNQPIRVSESWFGDSLEEAIKFLYECAEKKSSSKDGKSKCKTKKVILLADRAEKPNDPYCDVSRTYLLALYAKADDRFAKLCTILGIWKQRRFDKIDQKGVFSMYAFELMLIQFLQHGCQPPVLPSIQRLGIDPETRKTVRIKFQSENKMSLGRLLFSFFSYYRMKENGGFDFENYKISVKEGKPVKLAEPSTTFWIEDPMEKESKNVVDGAKSPGISYILAYTFDQIRTRLITKRRLRQLEDSIVI